jgi:hypothetical protein
MAEKSDVNDVAEMLAAGAVVVAPDAAVVVLVVVLDLLQPTNPTRVVAAVARSAARFSDRYIKVPSLDCLTVFARQLLA